MSIEEEIKEHKKIYTQMAKTRPEFSYRTLLWSSLEAQQKRFEQMKNLCLFKNKKILDVGCGVGDFLKYLQNNSLEVNYTGVDIIEEFIKEASYRHPEAKFLLQNILEPAFSSVYDIVVASGIFSFSSREFIEKMILKMFSIAKECICFNIFLGKDDEGFTDVTKRDLLDLFFNRGLEKFYIVEDYDPHDITILIHK